MASPWLTPITMTATSVHVWWRVPSLWSRRATCGHLIAKGRSILVDDHGNVRHDGCRRPPTNGSRTDAEVPDGQG